MIEPSEFRRFDVDKLFFKDEELQFLEKMNSGARPGGVTIPRRPGTEFNTDHGRLSLISYDADLGGWYVDCVKYYQGGPTKRKEDDKMDINPGRYPMRFVTNNLSAFNLLNDWLYTQWRYHRLHTQRFVYHPYHGSSTTPHEITVTADDKEMANTIRDKAIGWGLKEMSQEHYAGKDADEVISNPYLRGHFVRSSDMTPRQKKAYKEDQRQFYGALDAKPKGVFIKGDWHNVNVAMTAIENAVGKIDYFPSKENGWIWIYPDTHEQRSKVEGIAKEYRVLAEPTPIEDNPLNPSEYSHPVWGKISELGGKWGVTGMKTFIAYFNTNDAAEQFHKWALENDIEPCPVEWHKPSLEKYDTLVGDDDYRVEWKFGANVTTFIQEHPKTNLPKNWRIKSSSKRNPTTRIDVPRVTVKCCKCGKTASGYADDIATDGWWRFEDKDYCFYCGPKHKGTLKEQTEDVNPSSVQSVLFDYRNWTWSAREAKSWLKKHGLKFAKLDKTANYLRFRQFTPSKTKPKRIIQFGKKGIKAIVEFESREFVGNPGVEKNMARGRWGHSSDEPYKLHNWNVEVYGFKTNKIIASWKIENRTENEARKEAEADVARMGYIVGDWSLTKLSDARESQLNPAVRLIDFVPEYDSTRQGLPPSNLPKIVRLDIQKFQWQDRFSSLQEFLQEGGATGVLSSKTGWPVKGYTYERLYTAHHAPRRQFSLSDMDNELRPEMGF